MKWEKVKLGEYADVLSGYAYKSSDFCGTGVPVIKITNVKPPIISLEEASCISEEIANAKQQYILEYNDVLVAMTGSHVNQMNSVVGRVGRVKYKVKSVLNQRVGKIFVKDNSRLDLTFLYYYLGQEKIKFELANVATGSANQANISPNNIRELLIPCPPLEKQQRIASTLSTYDDLIENNQKQIKLLEEAAQRLYKEWFVDLRFPGYEDVEIVDGLPKGWELKKAIEVFDITIGRTPPRSQKECFTTNNKGIAWVSIADMGSSDAFILETNEDLTEDAVRNFNVSLVPKGTILLSFKLTVGRVAIANKELCTNEAIAHFRLDDESFTEFLYFYLKNFNYDALGNTSAISKAINSTIVKNMKIVIPDKALLDMFHNLTKPIFKKIETLQIGIKELKEARDRVLPKLMSGEVEV